MLLRFTCGGLMVLRFYAFDSPVIESIESLSDANESATHMGYRTGQE